MNGLWIFGSSQSVNKRHGATWYVQVQRDANKSYHFHHSNTGYQPHHPRITSCSWYECTHFVLSTFVTFSYCLIFICIHWSYLHQINIPAGTQNNRFSLDGRHWFSCEISFNQKIVTIWFYLCWIKQPRRFLFVTITFVTHQ